ncbi:MAG: polysaccharide deacetylase family protein [Pirellulaceae bacterium]|nr:polysaccharide deacetylase family protein [Pirellulaceae bacterium]
MSNLPQDRHDHAQPSAARVPRGKTRRIGTAQRMLAAAATTLSAVFGPREPRSFGILMYHRVTNVLPGLPAPTWNVTPEHFEAQLTGLLQRGFRARPLRDLLDLHRRGQPISPGTFVVTFDDAYGNVFLNAFPILQKLQIPATLFLATAYLDLVQPFPSDDWSAAGTPAAPVDSWRPLTTAECLEMQASGLVELAAHTHTHADFRTRPDDLLLDLMTNQAVLREKFGVENATFAFPYGTKSDGFSCPVLAAVVKAADLSCALTTEGQLVRPGDDPFDWGRFAAEDHDTAATLAAKLDGWHTAVRWLGLRVLGRPTYSPASPSTKVPA